MPDAFTCGWCVVACCEKPEQTLRRPHADLACERGQLCKRVARISDQSINVAAAYMMRDFNRARGVKNFEIRVSASKC